MAYLDDTRLLIRSVIFDMTTPYTYSDDKLNELIIASAKLIQFEIASLSDYVISINDQTIVPDPSDNFIALLVLKTACLIANAESKTYSLGALVVKDGPSTISSTEAAGYANERRKTICEEYLDAKIQYISGNDAFGVAIIGSIVEGSYMGNIGNL